MDKKTAREEGYFIIPTDDWDRYLWEVFANNDLVHIATSSEEANKMLEELWDKHTEEVLSDTYTKKWN